MLRVVLTLAACGCGRAPAPPPAGSASGQPVAKPVAALVSVPVAAASARGGAAVQNYACTELPLLSYYRAAGAVQDHTPTRLKLALRIDLHALDCGAPDATGHTLEVDLALEAEHEHCWVRSGSVKATPFGLEYEAQEPWQDELRPDGRVDLARVDPRDAVLRGVTTPRALLLTPEQYWLFEDVKPGAPLRQSLPDESGLGCCFGFTGAGVHNWDYEYAPHFSLAPPPSDEPERNAFNAWATRSGLRHQLEALVRDGFNLAPRDHVLIELAETEPSLAATVGVHGWHPAAEGEINAVLQFSRKACATCLDGVSGWWLWKASAPEQ